MKKSYLVLPVIILSIMGFFIINNTSDKEVQTSRTENSKRDNPQKRVEWEHMLLKDPATGNIPENIRSKELEYSKVLANELKQTKSSPSSIDNILEIATWQSNGPSNIGGRTRALAYDVSNPTVILAGGVSGGMWKTTDSGVTWNRKTLLSELASVTCVVQDQRNGKTNTWYYGSGERIGNSASDGSGSNNYPGDGIYKSTDNGETWKQLSSTAGGTITNQGIFSYVYRVAVDNSNTSQDEIYAAADGAIMRSLDGGNSWENVLDSGYPEVYTDMIITSSGVVYATFSSDSDTPGIWRSTTGNNGDWTDITPVGWPDNFNRVVIASAPSNEKIIYTLAEVPDQNPAFWKYNFVSGNGSGAGGTWEDRSNSLPDGSGSIDPLSLQGGYNMIVAVKPDNPDVVLVGGVDLIRSTNGFTNNTTNTRIGGTGSGPLGDYPEHFPDQHAIAFHPTNSNLIISGNDGGVFRTDNVLAGTVSWNPLNNRYITTQYYGIAIDYASSSKIVTGGMQDRGNFFVNSALNNTGIPMDNSGLDGTFNAIAANGAHYYFGAQEGGLFRASFTDNGTKSNFAQIDPLPQIEGLLFVNPYTMDPANSEIIYYAGGQTLLRTNSASTEDGNGWTTLNNSQVNNAIITAIGVSKANNSNVVYYGTQDGQLYRLDNANSGDPSRVDIYSGKGLPNGYINNIAVDKTNSSNALVVFTNYNLISLYYTTNAGNSWIPVAGNLEENPDGSGNGPSIRWATIMNYNGNTYYLVATSTGIYSTTNLNGMNTQWSPEAQSVVGNVVCTMILTRDSDGFIAVGSHGNGLFTASTGVTNLEKDENSIPNSFVLNQNYPNPFNPSTTIKFSVPQTANVELNIYNSNGESVKTLINGQLSTGIYEVVWDSRNTNGIKVASGIYFYTLKSSGYIHTKKMILVK